MSARRAELFAIVTVLAIGAGLVGAWAWRAASPEPPTAVAPPGPVLTGGIGSPRPALTLRDVDGSVHDEAEWDGRVLLVNFWATWCPPCRDEMPRLIELQRDYDERGLSVIGIALDSPELVAAYAERMGVNYTMLWGEQDAIDLAHGFGIDVVGLPISAVVDRQGQVVALHIGELHDEDLAELLMPLLED